MSTAVPFDTHRMILRLKERGMPEAQAEAVVSIMQETRESDLAVQATKRDLIELELRLKLHIGAMIFALGGILIAIKYI